MYNHNTTKAYALLMHQSGKLDVIIATDIISNIICDDNHNTYQKRLIPEEKWKLKRYRKVNKNNIYIRMEMNTTQLENEYIEEIYRKQKVNILST